MQIGARTGDRLRDVDGDVLARARRRLSESGIAGDALQHLDRALPSSSAEMNRVFGEPLPDGLRLQT